MLYNLYNISLSYKRLKSSSILSVRFEVRRLSLLTLTCSYLLLPTVACISDTLSTIVYLLSQLPLIYCLLLPPLLINLAQFVTFFLLIILRKRSYKFPTPRFAIFASLIFSAKAFEISSYHNQVARKPSSSRIAFFPRKKSQKITSWSSFEPKSAGH